MTKYRLLSIVGLILLPTGVMAEGVDLKDRMDHRAHFTAASTLTLAGAMFVHKQNPEIHPAMAALSGAVLGMIPLTLWEILGPEYDSTDMDANLLGAGFGIALYWSLD